MAATPKPKREQMKRMAAFTRQHSPEQNKGVLKTESQTRTKKMKEKGMKKSDINTMKQMHRKASKLDLAKAHKHMKEHGG